MPANEGDVSARLGVTLDSIKEGVQIISREWKYLYVNESVCRQGKKQRDELLGRTMSEVYPGIEASEMYRVLSQCMADREPRAFENEFVHDDGSRASFDLRVEPCQDGIFVLSLDVTDKKRLESQLRQAQKMDAIGRLAGGVAHDFNNLLTGIQSFTELALDSIEEGHPARDDLAEVLKAGERAAGLTRQLLAFARKQAVQPRVLDVNVLVGSVDKLLRRLIGEHIDIVTRKAPALWSTVIDPGAFEQVLLNLAVNARDAMPNGGCLTIETSNSELDSAHSLRRGGVMAAGDYVVLTVSDDGCGMDAATQERIFEPFFTTKEVGKGAGLGLATSYGIVAQAGGHIWVYSEVGQGTTFRVYLPRHHGAAEATELRAPQAEQRGSEVVLIVEDDEQVRAAAVRSLARLGYQVLAAAGAEEAGRHCERLRGPIDLLITDVVLPGINGRELAARMQERYPRIRTLFVSGYSEAAIIHRGVLAPDTQMLAKPFTPRALAQKVRLLLDAEIA